MTVLNICTLLSQICAATLTMSPTFDFFSLRFCLGRAELSCCKCGETHRMSKRSCFETAVPVPNSRTSKDERTTIIHHLAAYDLYIDCVMLEKWPIMWAKALKVIPDESLTFQTSHKKSQGFRCQETLPPTAGVPRSRLARSARWERCTSQGGPRSLPGR